MSNSDLLKAYLAQIGLSLDDGKIAALLSYCDLVLEANKQFNLTAITDMNEFFIKHVTDSLLGASEIPSGARLLDIGAGAGFPSMPIAIARPDVCVTALDSTAKKMRFVEQSAKSIGIDNLKTVAGRAEEQSALFGKFDVVTARAVSSLPILLELAMPMLKVGGRFLAYKTDESELPLASNALKTLCAKHIRTKFASLPNGDGRAILVFEKIAKTPPQYPRQYGAIKRKPL
ncbi:MAG: 16S rRNA (guanine(527)-N(7))-methyltransferase RsmG [Bacteroides sp.]|nr:16S rRNA (guanine(527)-N(7))-methyltransferase RsmG [Bacillota bacterium]MCM1394245.1 16S rRNA (guanine(527)-N(7))-methyltransferase RsmG [[Eubacterium] siraeum]MCM1455254.1 16S rRNA (guanine(527)-N(7))-methyltransferase RsmG [Bacteroides sp.]